MSIKRHIQNSELYKYYFPLPQSYFPFSLKFLVLRFQKYFIEN